MSSLFRVGNFQPFGNYAVTLNGSSQNTVITQPTTTTGALGATDLMISNGSNAVIYAVWGIGVQTADTTKFAILPGAIVMVNTGVNVTGVAVIGAGAGNVYLSIGVGA